MISSEEAALTFNKLINSEEVERELNSGSRLNMVQDYRKAFLIISLVLAAGLGGLYYFKYRKGTKQTETHAVSPSGEIVISSGDFNLSSNSNTTTKTLSSPKSAK